MRGFVKKNKKIEFCVKVLLYDYPNGCHRKMDEKHVYDFFLVSKDLLPNSDDPEVYNIPEDVLDHHPLSMTFTIQGSVKASENAEKSENKIPDIKTIEKKAGETLSFERRRLKKLLALDEAFESSTQNPPHQTLPQSKAKEQEVLPSQSKDSSYITSNQPLLPPQASSVHNFTMPPSSYNSFQYLPPLQQQLPQAASEYLNMK